MFKKGFIFPSLSSILPFLEIASPSDSRTWFVETAQLLEKYVAIWLKPIDPQDLERGNSMPASVICSQGLELSRFSLSVKAEDNNPPGGKDFASGEMDSNMLALVPESWASLATWEEISQCAICSAVNSSHQEVWTVTKETIRDSLPEIED